MLLNGFEVQCPGELEIVVVPMIDPSQVKPERERLAGYWFVHWAGGNLHCLRLRPGGPNLAGTPKLVSTSECVWLLRARVDDVIETVFDKYQALRYRPFTVLAKLQEVIKTVVENLDLDPTLLQGFTIHPKLTLQAKVLEPRDGDVKLGVFVGLGMRHQVTADLEDLRKKGVDLSNLYVVLRSPERNQRRLAGRIDRIEAGMVHMSEATGPAVMPVPDLTLEGSLEVFARCLKPILGARYTAFKDAIDDIEAGSKIGPKYDEFVRKIGGFLQQKSPISLGLGLQASVGARLNIRNELGITSTYTAPKVEYVFDRSGSKRSEYAWQGLLRHGPCDRVTFAKKSPRILVLYPDKVEGKVETFIRSLKEGVPPPARNFPNGFGKLFGLVNPSFVSQPVRLFGGGEQPVEAIYRKAAELFLEREDVDAAIVVILDEHAALPPLRNPYLRTKALFLTMGIPTQEVRLQTVAKRPNDLQWILQNFSVALYAKLNGTPWTVDQDKAISDEIIVGMGVTELSGSRVDARQRFVGITTVFSGDGNYILGSASRECTYEDYPATLRTSMSSILLDIKQRNGWAPGDTVRIIFHAHKPLKKVEVAAIVLDCARSVGTDQRLQMAFLTVSHEHPFYLFDPDEKGVPAKKDSPEMKGVLAPERGTITRIGRWTLLVCVNSHLLIKRANSPLPKPLLVNLHQDSTFVDLDYLAEQVVKFTSLSWRSTLPVGTPVTIYYSELIASLLAKLRQIPDWSPTALNIKLRWSRWFL